MPPLSLLIKPASGSCNMRCRYCFYTDEAENRAVASMGRMAPETMRVLVDKALTWADGDCAFAFQGGEPSLAGLDFFRGLTDYVSAHPNPKGVRVHYASQTNGYALDEEWAQWFARHNVLVGISLDGPKDLHDRYRVDREGKGTFNRVMASIRLLERYAAFLKAVFDAWYVDMKAGRYVYNRYFENLMMILSGQAPESCNLRGLCVPQ